jgi:hypothetical protein
MILASFHSVKLDSPLYKLHLSSLLALLQVATVLNDFIVA